MRSLPPLAAVRVFEAAARQGNFTRAAEELGMTQAAVSHQVKLLEDRVGGPLFVRTARGAALTDLGQRLAPAATAALDGIARAFADIRSEHAASLSISAVVSFGTLWLAPRLGCFMAAHPHFSVRLEADNGFADFGSGVADVGIRSGSGSWPGLTAHLLFRWHCTPMAAPSLLSAHPPIAEPGDLLALPRTVGDNGWWDHWFAAMGVTVPLDALRAPGLLLESQVLEGQAVIAGQGVAMLTPAFWKREIAEGRLAMPFPRCAGFQGGYYLVYPEGADRQQKIRAFRDWIIAESGPDRAG